MLTVTSKLQYDQCRREINLLELEQSIKARELQKVTGRISNLKDAYGEEACESVPEYQDLVAYNSELEVRNKSIETELKLLRDDQKAFQKLQENGIKEQTSFWWFGGG